MTAPTTPSDRSEPGRATGRFGRADRLLKPAEFRRVYRRRRSVADARVIIYGSLNGHGRPRLGCSVSRKVGNAVVRNRVKRRFREAFRLERSPAWGGIDLVLIPRPGGVPTLAEVRRALRTLVPKLIRKLHAQAQP